MLRGNDDRRLEGQLGCGLLCCSQKFDASLTINNVGHARNHLLPRNLSRIALESLFSRLRERSI